MGKKLDKFAAFKKLALYFCSKCTIILEKQCGNTSNVATCFRILLGFVMTRAEDSQIEIARSGVVTKRDLDHTLCHHGASDFHEAGDIGALDVVDVTIRLLAVLDALLVDAVHNFVQALIDIGCAPADVSSILAHFEARGCYATCVDGLAWGIEHLLFEEEVDGFGSASHVGDFGNALNTVGNELGCILAIEFVLGSTRQGDVAWAFPWTLAWIEGCFGELVGIRSHDIVA